MPKDGKKKLLKRNQIYVFVIAAVGGISVGLISIFLITKFCIKKKILEIQSEDEESKKN